MRRARWAGAALLLGACIDFTPVEPDVPPPSRPEPAFFSAVLSTVGGRTGQPRRLIINAHLRAGRDAAGAPRRLPADTLWVGSRPLLPVFVPGGDVVHYHGELVLPNTDSAMVAEIRPPAFPGMRPLPAILQGVPSLVGETDTLAVTRGADLELRLRPGSHHSDPPAQGAGWSLRLSRGGWALEASGSGAPPEVIRVPAAQLALGPEEGPIDATLRVGRSASWKGAEEYHLEVVLSTQHAWVIRLVDPPR